MSYTEAHAPECSARHDAVELVIRAKEKNLGGFSVRRVLPSIDRRMVGPFVFFDHMGPAVFAPGEAIDVRPHPHIGLSTVTYLFEGEILHRDSLGIVQPIQPGAINLMTAGSGIVHSERVTDAVRQGGQRLHGIQTWMALPDGKEEVDPAFVHVPADRLPQYESEGVQARVILGQAFGQQSPVETHADTLYVHLELRAGAQVALPEAQELAVYNVSGAVGVGECELEAGAMAVLRDGRTAQLKAAADSKVMLAGGAPVGRRHIHWNFVSSSKERIERAKEDWRQDRFERVPGDEERIPLPG